MTLSLLRWRILAGFYADDLRCLEYERLLFARWLYQTGRLHDW